MTVSRGAPPGPSRAATNQLLVGLRAGRFRPTAWKRFFLAATVRSMRQALAHPRAVAETTALHIAFLLAAPRRRAAVAASWLLSVTHLGMLEEHRSLGLPNVLTLIRGNLSSFTRGNDRTDAVLALVLDVLDGRLARATEQVTPFGAAADFLADAVVWNRLAFDPDSPRWLRVVSTTAWSAPIVAVAVSSIAGGRMRDVPRSRLLRPAALAEGLIFLRLLRLPTTEGLAEAHSARIGDGSRGPQDKQEGC